MTSTEHDYGTAALTPAREDVYNYLLAILDDAKRNIPYAKEVLRDLEARLGWITKFDRSPSIKKLASSIETNIDEIDEDEIIDLLEILHLNHIEELDDARSQIMSMSSDQKLHYYNDLVIPF